MIHRTCLLIILTLLFWLPQGQAAERTALVIGNSSYRSAPLDNSVNDAQDMATVLETLGFEVVLKLNADKKSMLESLRVFGKNLAASKIGLFYYAGHGIQIKGINYLVPVKNQIREVSEVEFESIDAGRILAKMETAGNPMNILILDACRDNPFKGTFRTTIKGLAKMDAPPGTILAYSTSPGSVSADGKGRNGLYTEVLLKNIQSKGLHVRDMFNKTGLEVMEKTENKQVPWISASPFPDFYLAGRSITVVSPYKEAKQSTVLKIDSDPAGAKIHVNGKYSGLTPIELSGIPEGDYKITASLEGFKPSTKTILVKPEGKSILKLYLEPADKKPRLFVTTDPADCRVRILNILPVFFNGIPLDPGSYKIEVSKPGFSTQVKWITLAETSERMDLHVSLKRTGNRKEPMVSSGKENTWVEPVTGMTFVWVPSGCFEMGSPFGREDEKPVHKTCVGGFWMGKFEVTKAQFRKFVQTTGYWTDAQKAGAAYIWTGKHWEREKRIDWKNLNFSQNEDHPVTSISWNDAKAFADWLSRTSKRKIRMPREAEWEYAARSRGKIDKFSGGNDLNRVAWYAENSGNRTHPVGQKKPNALGLYDMSGNVWEWCEDVYDKKAYASRPDKKRKPPREREEKVLRGGSWNDIPRFARTTVRNSDKPIASFSDYGFRLVVLP